MQLLPRAAVQDIHHPAAGVPHIHAALADVVVVHIVQPRGKDLLGPLHRGGAAGAGGYVIADLVGEGLVLQQRDLEHQNIGVGPLGVLLQAAQLVLGQHDGRLVQRALPEGVADDAVQTHDAAVQPHHRAGRDAGRNLGSLQYRHWGPSFVFCFFAHQKISVPMLASVRATSAVTNSSGWAAAKAASPTTLPSCRPSSTG